jgi:hypothetical protein
MNRAGLPMTTLRSMRFGLEGSGEIRKSWGYYRPGRPTARMGPEPLVWLVHISPEDQKNDNQLQALYSSRQRN